MKDSKRALRRHHRRRMIVRSARMVRDTWGLDPWESHLAPRFANNMKHCSCHMCGNPRKYWKAVTRQEEAAALSEREQRRDLDGG